MNDVPQKCDVFGGGKELRYGCRKNDSDWHMASRKLALTSEGAIVGAAPAGARDEQRAATAAVREMFTSIAPRYDLLNHVLSMNVDRLWWNRTARELPAYPARPDAQVLDLCCGTGDMTFALHRRTDGKSAGDYGRRFFPCDAGARGRRSRATEHIRWVEADALEPSASPRTISIW